MDIDKEIEKFVLQNSIKFNGKANPGAVIGKLMSVDPNIKSQLKELSLKINKKIAEISKLSVEEQTSILENLAPELLKKEKKEHKKELPDLKGAEFGKVVTRLPPEPSKYLHIGHALSFLINYMYAKKYDGWCILKPEDTNPDKCSKEFADAIEDDIKNYLGIETSETVYISDEMDYMIEKADKLVHKGHAYVCFCKREDMQEFRHSGKVCSCRSRPSETHLTEWKNMKDRKYEASHCSLRLKGDMESTNHVMRDPVLWRINYTPHFRHGDKYCVWPMYDFENSVMDCKYGVTHIFRSSEFGEMRNELQNYIKDLFGWPKQVITHYARFSITGSITSGREIRKLIEEKKVSGWDDPSLVTLQALKRRGIVKEALYDLVYQVGLTLSNTNIDWTVLSSINRQILDSKVNRYFFITEAKKIKIKNSPELVSELNLHPDFPERGQREFKTGSEFYLEKKDIESFKENSLNRLMDCINFRKRNNQYLFDSVEYEKFKGTGEIIVHWLPVSEDLTKVEVLMPDSSIISGIAESGVKNLKIGDIVQFTRFGFCRLDAVADNKFCFVFTHK
ncbi:MAG: glutamate--tRNA ligase [Nanoarchaeota archaeon]|nr:glutamate--tRNA ligase [Nanoarchaeota archaeon]